MLKKSTDKKIAIIGCGRAGSNIGIWLSNSGYRIESLFDAARERAERLSERTGRGKVFEKAEDAAKSCDIVFISTPDGIIERTCSDIADLGGFTDGKAVFHLSGSLSSSVLLKAAEHGAFTASFHPLQSLAGENEEMNPFKGILMALEGHPEAVELAREMSEALGARPYEIEGRAKTLYHASAVIASNYLVSLMKLASEVMAASGIPEDQALDFLMPLVKGTLSNMEKMGVEKALTGPIARGDVKTVSSHLEAIREKLPDLERAYIELGKLALKIASAQKFISDQEVKDFKEIL